MNVIHTLNDKLLGHTPNIDQQHINLSRYQDMARMYSQNENSIAVLSDLKANKSYIYHGRVAEELGLMKTSATEEINSIWEEEIFAKIHPEDLLDKHLLELQFFNMLKGVPVADRSDYHVKSTLRMRNRNNQYIAIVHRIFYVATNLTGNPWLALCLYNLAYNAANGNNFEGSIFNSATGNMLSPGVEEYARLLSYREKEILQLIRNGMISKEIAQQLSISLYTVNRHRQNILEKLRVNNSHEACRIAEKMNLI